MPLLTLAKAAELIGNVQATLLTSHNIVSRIDYPQFYGSPAIPEDLIQFKEKLTIYRKNIAELIARLNKSPQFKTGLPQYNHADDLSNGSVSHELVLSLVLSSLGIGECGECSTRLMIELSKSGYSDFARIGIAFPAATEGSERFHSLMIVNLHKPPALPAGVPITFPLLLSCLPKQVVIVDPFLGLCFRPNQVPIKFQQYLAAYGNTTALASFNHFYNVSTTLFDAYLSLADRVKSILFREVDLPNLDELPLKIPKDDMKRTPLSHRDFDVLTLPIPSPQADHYLSDLDRVLGEAHPGQKIVKKEAKSAFVSFPSFWLKQLGKEAIQELSEQLSVTPEQLRSK